MLNVVLDDHYTVRLFMREMEKRQEGMAVPVLRFVRKEYKVGSGVLHCMRFDWKVFPVYWLGLVASMVGLVFGWMWLVWTGLVVYASVFFYTPFFFYFVFLFGLRKKGYRGRRRLLLSEKALEEIVNDGTGRGV